MPFPVRARLALLPLLVGGCDLGPDYARPALDVPPAYRATAETAKTAWPSPDWWRGFNSRELDGLIADARAHNLDIAAAVARVVQADAQVRQAGAALLPTLSGSASRQYERTGSTTGFGGLSGLGGLGGLGTAGLGTQTLGGSGSRYYDIRTTTLQASASYEVDFWGKARASEESARASAVSSRFDQETTALTVVTNVANTWFSALAFNDRLEVAQRNVADAESSLRVLRGRVEAGTGTALDVAQEEAQVETQRALVPNLRSQAEQQVIALGILTGRPPESVTVKPGTLAALSLPDVSPGLPSALLERRPDVAAAEAQLVAAQANVRVARAAFFPQLQLTAAGGVQSAAFTTLFGPGALLAQLGASLTAPIFDGGTLRGQLEQAKGKYAELLADYRKAVLQALTDVDTALTAYHYATLQEAAQARAVNVAQRAVTIAEAQLHAGTVDVTTLLTSQATLYTAQDTLAQVRLVRFQALLNLYKALGGGWGAPSGPIPNQFPGLSPGTIGGGVALPIGGNLR
jgi:NodT family efflux transporter outer membrane factor (OMF) lipoprotein